MCVETVVEEVSTSKKKIKDNSKLASEWHYSKNIDLGLNIDSLSNGSAKVAWWTCSKCNSDYDMLIKERTIRGRNCPYCKGRRVNHTNSLKSISPNIAKDWDFAKNFPLTPDNVTKKSNKIAWWLCGKCNSSYDMKIVQRQSNGCPYCSGYRKNDSNSLAMLKSELASQWHPTKNGELSAHDVSCGSGKKVWWICEKGHDWEAPINNRRSRGCPYCGGVYAWRGFSDIWTTDREMASMLLNKDEGYSLMKYSEKKVDWKCECGNIVRGRQPKSVSLYGLCCPLCSEGKSYSERFIGNLLFQHYSGEVKPEKVFKWLPLKRYDYYLPNINLIIEIHGDQHYREAPSFNKTLKFNQKNDENKMKKALENGIEEYIVVDARRTYLSFLKKSVTESGLMEFLDDSDIDWDKIHKDSIKSLKFECAKLYNEGSHILEIAEKLGISKGTTYNYLKICTELGLCNFIPHDRRVGVIQKTKENLFIAEYVSIKEASKTTGIAESAIALCARGETKTSGGFKWVRK